MYGELFLASATSSRDAGLAFVLSYVILAFAILGGYVFFKVLFQLLIKGIEMFIKPKEEVDRPKTVNFIRRTHQQRKDQREESSFHQQG